MKILISACLLGEKVRYDGGGKLVEDDRLKAWADEGRLVPICPEMAGGLPTPRPPAEIQGLDGQAVLNGDSKVTTRNGDDVTQAFVGGAHAAAALARDNGVRLAILKARSPSCGAVQIYDGSFSGKLQQGQGVAAAALRAMGVQVFDEEHLDEAAACLEQLEASSDTL